MGYQLTITDSAQFAAYQASLQDQAQPAMPAKRLPALMHVLLTTTEYLTVAQLAEHELISSKQLQRDLRELEKLLIGTPLQLERKAHYGIRLQGEWQSRIHALQQRGLPPHHQTLCQRLMPLGWIQQSRRSLLARLVGHWRSKARQPCLRQRQRLLLAY